MTRRKSKAERWPINDGGPEVYRRLVLGGRLSRDMSEWPEDLRVREYPR